MSSLCCFLVALGVSQNISDEILIGGDERPCLRSLDLNAEAKAEIYSCSFMHMTMFPEERGQRQGVAPEDIRM